MVAVFSCGTGQRLSLFPRLLLLSILLAIPAWAYAREAAADASDGQRFLAVSLNEVSGDPPDHQHLAAFFDWLSGDGWTAITLDDIERARRGEKPLPDKAILLSFDNGYRDLYLRVFPLARKHDMPVVASLVDDRLDASDEHFITWEQAREMQASGLIEFAADSKAPDEFHSMGHGDGEDAFRDRLRADLQHSRERLQRNLGRTPRAVTCPYGRCNPMMQELASELGFGFALSLEPELASTARPMAIGRYLPLNTPVMGYLVPQAGMHHALPAWLHQPLTAAHMQGFSGYSANSLRKHRCELVPV